MMISFQSSQLPVDIVSLSYPHKDSSDYLELNLAVFPSEGVSFNRTGINSIGFVLSNQTYKPSKLFGPFYFIGHQYTYFAGNISNYLTETHGPLPCPSRLSLFFHHTNNNLSPSFSLTDVQVPTTSKKSSNIGVIVGAAAGGFVLLSLLALVGIYAFRQKKRAEKATEQSNPFGMGRFTADLPLT